MACKHAVCVGIFLCSATVMAMEKSTPKKTEMLPEIVETVYFKRAFHYGHLSKEEQASYKRIQQQAENWIGSIFPGTNCFIKDLDDAKKYALGHVVKNRKKSADIVIAMTKKAKNIITEQKLLDDIKKANLPAEND
ncbi:MAG TPA: hypothetical protein VEK38_03855 [Candidatus Bathyarchaeia archaeon]|nr:hypothetical protein [Candidatus Bathyarchaeia archaeon]